MELKPGVKFASAVSEAEVVVVRAPAGDVDLACGGSPMVAPGGASPVDAVLDSSLGDGPQVGKRYADDEVGLEVLCSRSGAGLLTVDGRTLGIKGAKPLPASD